jgi:hypothetical protein
MGVGKALGGNGEGEGVPLCERVGGLLGRDLMIREGARMIDERDLC